LPDDDEIDIPFAAVVDSAADEVYEISPLPDDNEIPPFTLLIYETPPVTDTPEAPLNDTEPLAALMSDGPEADNNTPVIPTTDAVVDDDRVASPPCAAIVMGAVCVVIDAMFDDAVIETPVAPVNDEDDNFDWTIPSPDLDCMDTMDAPLIDTALVDDTMMLLPIDDNATVPFCDSIFNEFEDDN